MTRGSLIILYVFLICASLAALFQTKYTVLDLENEHAKLRASLRESQERLHVLRAEWACLNDPERLFKLSKKHLALRPIHGKQIIAYKDLQNSGMGEYDRERLMAIINGGQKKP
jgi:cell division protein FtsL